jgi:hypothetical protein
LSTVKKLGINPGNQEDSTEFFGNLVEEIEGELKNPKGLNWKGKPGLRNLLWAGLTEFTVCKECKEQNWTNNSGTVVRLEIDQLGQGTSTIADELHKVLHPRDKPSPCGQCKRTTNKSVSAPSQELSDYFCLNVPRKAWNAKTGKMERLKHKVRPEKVLSVKIGPKKAESLYSLTGGIVHLGEANSGHYLNILNISGVWFEVSDAKVKEITDSEALRSLESNGVLLTYRKSLSPANRGQTQLKEHIQAPPGSQLKEHVQAPLGRRKIENKAGKTEPLGRRQRFPRRRPQLERTEYKRSSSSEKRNLLSRKGSGKTSHRGYNETQGPALGERRQRFPRSKGNKEAFRPKRSQGREPEAPKGYYDPDKRCYYIPKI